ncbi:hypothetical protein [Desulfonatronovibrio hydrogenovorans]|uniref:hypothetical protein n=1 Tax=Desulfonatronovibrio hydrogenovorans TaxID=53245 RepID=UPI0012376BB3|nr:hypothetical protein [Desulfonatronovibrio hydrogenovorans]
MFCQKCRYVSFDHLGACPKCGHNWAEQKKKLGIDWLRPGEKSWLQVREDRPDSGSAPPGPDRTEHTEMTDFFSNDADPAEQGALSSGADRVKTNLEQESGRKTGLPDQDAISVQEKKVSDQGLEEEIEYPELEFFDPDKDRKHSS